MVPFVMALFYQDPQTFLEVFYLFLKVVINLLQSGRPTLSPAVFVDQ
jgi:hypothetical protein